MTWQAKVLCDGEASGEVLRLQAPISFWGGVNPENAQVVQAAHPQHGRTLRGKVVVAPEMIGSSSSAAVLLELIYKSIAPAGIIMGQPDAILPVGAIVARQMGWAEMPVFQLDAPVFETGDILVLEPGGIIRRTDVAQRV